LLSGQGFVVSRHAFALFFLECLIILLNLLFPTMPGFFILIFHNLILRNEDLH
jgi:hypothetical protein